MLSEFIAQNNLPKSFSNTAKEFYIPLADKLFSGYLQLAKQNNNNAFFVGINGCQGSGKTTLSKFLAHYLEKQYNLSVVTLSLDDFYLSKNKRQQLAKDVHPLFQTRGVPGTHDVKWLKSTLIALRESTKENESIDLPCFDKAQDDVMPEFITVSAKADIVLFEGWCWGVPAQPFDELTKPINELEATKDRQAVWRNKVNELLQECYQDLYTYMDTWLMLKAPSFDVVFQWRLEQEQKLAKANVNVGNANKVMTTHEVNEFIQFFQRLTIHGLNVLPAKVDILFELGNHREIIASKGLY